MTNVGNVLMLVVIDCQIHAFSLNHSALYTAFNPLTTEFFPPRQHIFMHLAHTTFVGTPLPQHSLLSGQTWWGSHTWRAPLAIPLMIFMTPHKPSNRRSKVDVSRIFAQHFPKLGPDLTDGTPYTTNLHEALGGVYESH